MRLCRFQIDQIYQSTSFKNERKGCTETLLFRGFNQGWAMGMHCFQKNAMFLRSFTFFIKECCVLCVLLRFLLKNAKERCALFGFISHTKVTNLSKKECNTKNFFSIYYTYISIFIYIYLYLTIYIYIYIFWKKERGLGMRSFQKNATFLHFFAFLQKNVAFFAFFYVL